MLLEGALHFRDAPIMIVGQFGIRWHPTLWVFPARHTRQSLTTGGRTGQGHDLLIVTRTAAYPAEPQIRLFAGRWVLPRMVRDQCLHRRFGVCHLLVEACCRERRARPRYARRHLGVRDDYRSAVPFGRTGAPSLFLATIAQRRRRVGLCSGGIRAPRPCLSQEAARATGELPAQHSDQHAHRPVAAKQGRAKKMRFSLAMS